MPNTNQVAMRIKGLKGDSLVSSLVLADERDEVFLPVRLGAASAKAMQLELAGGHRQPSSVQDLLANTLRHLNGKIARVELRWEDRPGLLATMVIDQEGKEVRFPTRIADAMALAHRYGAPIMVQPFVLERQGIRAGETGAKAKDADWMEAFRLTCGFAGLGRTDDAILACRRLRELDPPNESWCVTLGNLYREKGMLTAAADELLRGLAWHAREGYLGMAVNIARDLAAIDFDSLALRTLRAPASIEDFNSPENNNERWGAGEVVPAPGGKPGKAYRLAGDRDWIIVKLLGGQTWEDTRSISVDLFVGPEAVAAKPLRVVFSLSLSGSRQGWYHVAPRELGEGWTTLTFPLADAIWNEGERKGLRLDASPLGPVTDLQLGLPDGRPASGDIYLANIRLE